MSNYLLMIPSIAIFYIAFFNICKLKFSMAEIFIAPVITYLFTAALLLLTMMLPFLDVDIVGNIVIVLSLVLIAYKKSKDWLLSGYYAMLTAILAMVSGSAVSIFADAFFSFYLYENRDNALLYFIAILFIFPVCFFSSRYLGNYIHRHYIQFNNEIKNKFIKYGFILSALTYTLANLNLLVIQLPIERVILSTFNVIVIITIFFISIIMIAAYSLAQQKQMETEHAIKAQDDLTSYTKKLEEAYDDMRRFRHDHLNLLYGLAGYIDNKNHTGLKEYLEQNVVNAKEALNALDKVMDQIKHIHIPELKGLLSVKLTQAQSSGIDLELDIAKPVDTIPIERIELCRIVGIILDNAVEELQSQKSINKILKLGIIIEEGDVMIICANTCTDVPSIENIFAKGYTTKGSNRGLGLYNLKQTCKKLGNVLLSAQAEDNVFTIIATISNLRG